MPDERPFREHARQLLDTFARGWSKGRVDLLIDLFHPQAILLEAPFSQPVQGHEAIRTWLADIPYHQSEIAFSTGELFVAGPWFSSEFKLVFRRRKTGEWVNARGALFAETDGEQITELRMYWHRHTGGAGPGPA
jgi:ketosteroid isomerase-like protein